MRIQTVAGLICVFLTLANSHAATKQTRLGLGKGQDTAPVTGHTPQQTNKKEGHQHSESAKHTVLPPSDGHTQLGEYKNVGDKTRKRFSVLPAISNDVGNLGMTSGDDVHKPRIKDSSVSSRRADVVFQLDLGNGNSHRVILHNVSGIVKNRKIHVHMTRNKANGHFKFDIVRSFVDKPSSDQQNSDKKAHINDHVEDHNYQGQVSSELITGKSHIKVHISANGAANTVQAKTALARNGQPISNANENSESRTKQSTDVKGHDEDRLLSSSLNDSKSRIKIHLNNHRDAKNVQAASAAAGTYHGLSRVTMNNTKTHMKIHINGNETGKFIQETSRGSHVHLKEGLKWKEKNGKEARQQRNNHMVAHGQNESEPVSDTVTNHTVHVSVHVSDTADGRALSDALLKNMHRVKQMAAAEPQRAVPDLPHAQAILSAQLAKMLLAYSHQNHHSMQPDKEQLTYLWSQWGSWGPCSATCGKGGTSARERFCMTVDGGNCKGKKTENRSCAAKPCPGSGKWSEWTTWADCTVTCGAGWRSRSRACMLRAGKKTCLGDGEQVQTCNRDKCPDNFPTPTKHPTDEASGSEHEPEIPAEWTPWNMWSKCSTTCGLGSEVRHRMCLSEQYGSHQKCMGPSADQRPCISDACNPGMYIQGNRDATVEAKEGHFAKLHCSHNGRRPVKKIYWVSPKGHRIDIGDENPRYKVKGNFLYMKHAEDFDKGTYHCVIVLADDRTTSADATLAVINCAHHNPCMNGGTCMEMADSKEAPFFHFQCRCPHHWSGQFCEQNKSNMVLVAAVVSSVFVAALVLICVCVMIRSRRRRYKKRKQNVLHPGRAAGPASGVPGSGAHCQYESRLPSHHVPVYQTSHHALGEPIYDDNFTFSYDSVDPHGNTQDHNRNDKVSKVTTGTPDLHWKRRQSSALGSKFRVSPDAPGSSALHLSPHNPQTQNQDDSRMAEKNIQVARSAINDPPPVEFQNDPLIQRHVQQAGNDGHYESLSHTDESYIDQVLQDYEKPDAIVAGKKPDSPVYEEMPHSAHGNKPYMSEPPPLPPRNFVSSSNDERKSSSLAVESHYSTIQHTSMNRHAPEYARVGLSSQYSPKQTRDQGTGIQNLGQLIDSTGTQTLPSTLETLHRRGTLRSSGKWKDLEVQKTIAPKDIASGISRELQHQGLLPEPSDKLSQKQLPNAQSPEDHDRSNNTGDENNSNANFLFGMPIQSRSNCIPQRPFSNYYSATKTFGKIAKSIPDTCGRVSSQNASIAEKEMVCLPNVGLESEFDTFVKRKSEYNTMLEPNHSWMIPTSVPSAGVDEKQPKTSWISGHLTPISTSHSEDGRNDSLNVNGADKEEFLIDLSAPACEPLNAPPQKDEVRELEEYVTQLIQTSMSTLSQQLQESE